MNAQLDLPFRDARHDAERVARALCRISEECHDHAAIFTADRHAPIVRARMIVAYILRFHLGHTCTAIGKALGGRDHSTVSYLTSTMRAQASSYADLRKPYRAVCAIIGVDPHRRLLTGAFLQTARDKVVDDEAQGYVKPMRWSVDELEALKGYRNDIHFSQHLVA